MVVALLTMMAWVRNIAKFSFIFLFANTLIFCAIIIIITYSSVKIHADGISPDVVPLNTKGMWSMVGFSIYTYEGIGILMPVMQACDCPEQFESLVFKALASLTFFYVILGTIGYLAYGQMREQMVT